MITPEDLTQAIAECMGAPNPSANTCMKLAAYFIIRDHIADTEISGDSEFMNAVRKSDLKHVLAVLDDVMKDLQAINPRMYDNAIKRILSGF